ncbi:MAG: hypothetical protein AAFQ07_07945, partial [Chloroflexota bacterium]
MSKIHKRRVRHLCVVIIVALLMQGAVFADSSDFIFVYHNSGNQFIERADAQDEPVEPEPEPVEPEPTPEPVETEPEPEPVQPEPEPDPVQPEPTPEPVETEPEPDSVQPEPEPEPVETEPEPESVEPEPEPEPVQPEPEPEPVETEPTPTEPESTEQIESTAITETEVSATPAPESTAEMTPDLTPELPVEPTEQQWNGSVAPLSVCWTGDQGDATAWYIDNPNPVPLTSNPERKVRFNYATNGGQSVSGWDNTGRTRIQTPHATSIPVEWYLGSGGQSGGILGSTSASTGSGSLCGNSSADPTPSPTVTDEPDTPTPAETQNESTLVATENTPSPIISVFDPSLSKLGYLPEGSIGLPGEELIWEVIVTNDGNIAGTDIVVRDDIRREMQIDNVIVADNQGITYTINGQIIDVMIPSLNPGESTTFYIETTVLENPEADEFTNIATIVGTGESASATIPILTRTFMAEPAMSMPPGPGDPNPNISGIPDVDVFAGSQVCFDAS